MGAFTDSLDIAPKRSFGAIRAQQQVLENSDIGILASGSIADRDNYNYAIGIDGAYRKGPNQFIMQGAFSDKNNKQGYAVSSGFNGFIRNYLVSATAKAIQDSFDVSDVGYVPWSGSETYTISAGPVSFYQSGFLRSLYYGPGVIVGRDPGTDKYSKSGIFSINVNFRNNWGLNINSLMGQSYEADLDFLFRQINLYAWATLFNQSWYTSCSYNYSYNYRRGMLAYQGYNGLGGGSNIGSRMKVSFDSNSWIEWDSLGSIIAITSVITPRIEYRINAEMNISIFNEFVAETPETELSETDLLSNRIGFLYSWNFKPKSWLYIALNDYQVADEQGKLQLANRVSAIKAKYLLYF
jgi:hypothetical protein